MKYLCLAVVQEKFSIKYFSILSFKFNYTVNSIRLCEKYRNLSACRRYFFFGCRNYFHVKTMNKEMQNTNISSYKNN